jgi:DNA topoisomerase-1
MAKNLVIVESPAKAKTINKMLGKDYIVLASMGHVRDLPEHSLGVDVDKGFEPRYEPIKSRAKTISNLVSQAAKAETVYLAPDPDREGEAIAWHLRELLRRKGDKDGKFRRVTYNEITASAIKRAFAAPGEIDMPRVDSQQARRILDRLVGYKVSPSLRRAIPGASSAGRVQSVALRLVCEREKAIRDFVPEPYWILGVRAAKQTPPTAPFTARLARIDGKKADIRDAAEAERLSAELRRRGLRVAAVLNKEVRRNAPPPFITSTLQQAASGALGYAPARTMKIAQKLYEGVDIGGGSGTTGLITYMRTDSVAVAAEAASAARACIERLYGPDFLPPAPPVYRSRSSAQEAHEAIRPTDPARTPDSLKGILDPDDWRLYDLVWRRFTASQMAPARIAQRTAEIEAVPLPGTSASSDTFLFRATVSEIAFPGFMRASGLEQRKRAAAPARAPDGREEESDEVDSLPPLAEGETLDPVEWLSDRKETQPPPRYTDASLVKALEENGVGRPSTYAQTIATLLDRKYADHDKRALVPTDLGMKACDYLVQHLSSLFDVQFTAAMEEQLDRVEEKQASWRDMLTDFYARFRIWLAALRGPEADTAAVDRLLAAFAHVTDWNPPVKRGARTYSDEKFVKSIRDQRESGERPLTARQQTALATVFQRYRDRIPGADAIAAELSLPDTPASAAPEAPRAAGTPAEAPAAPAASDAATAEKLALLANVTFAPPRKFGKRTYDDAAFCASLREQAQSGRALSPAQVGYLDKLLLKYAPQIPDFDQKRDALGLAAAPVPAAAAQLDALVSLFDTVTDWRPPTAGIRGRTWDDRDFYTSLRDQYRQSKTLSFKQVSALKRLASAYASQIPDYPAKAQALGLPPPRAPKTPKAPKDSKDPRP